MTKDIMLSKKMCDSIMNDDRRQILFKANSVKDIVKGTKLFFWCGKVGGTIQKHPIHFKHAIVEDVYDIGDDILITFVLK